MEILICTSSIQLWKKLFSLVDSFLCKKKSRYISVLSDKFTNSKAIFAAVKKHKSSIVILDVQSFDNWQEIVKEIETLNKSTRICLVSRTEEDAVNAINNLDTVCGYICRSKLTKMFKEVFSRIYCKIKTICGGIMITHYNSVNKIIPFEDIFFIETIKQTHICTIVHKNGSDEIRADISKIINDLPDVFQIVRSSAIANISKIKSYSDSELLFSDGSSCLCSKSHVSNLIPHMKQLILI